jgi:hypothetical protein
MKNAMNYSNVINMLNLWVTPYMWEEKTLFSEINAVIKKLSESSYQLSERELFLTQELVNGLLEATLTSFDRADDSLKGELALALNDITQFQSFIVTSVDKH